MGQFFCKKENQSEEDEVEQRRSGVFVNKIVPPLSIIKDEKIKVFFFPSKDNEQQLIQQLLDTKKSLIICVYTITNQKIMNSLLELVKKNRKLNVRIITDDVQTLLSSQRALLKNLEDNGQNQIKVKLDNSQFSLMHNKYAVIDDEIIITGSFNWTQKAVSTNRENLIIIRDKKTALEFTSNFELLWKLFTPMNLRIIQQEEEKKNKEEKLKSKSSQASPDVKIVKPKVAKKSPTKQKEIKILKKAIQKKIQKVGKKNIKLEDDSYSSNSLDTLEEESLFDIDEIDEE